MTDDVRLDQDAPMTLRHAAETLLHGVVKASTLRAAAERGDLEIEKLGRVYVVTPRAVREWRDLCRAAAKARASTPTESAANGSFATAQRSAEQAALSQIVVELTRPSRPISRKSSRFPTAPIVPPRSPPARSPTPLSNSPASTTANLIAGKIDAIKTKFAPVTP